MTPTSGDIAGFIRKHFEEYIGSMYNDEFLAEYNEVIRRPKFPFHEEAVGWREFRVKNPRFTERKSDVSGINKHMGIG